MLQIDVKKYMKVGALLRTTLKSGILPLQDIGVLWDIVTAQGLINQTFTRKRIVMSAGYLTGELSD